MVREILLELGSPHLMWIGGFVAILYPHTRSFPMQTSPAQLLCVTEPPGDVFVGKLLLSELCI